MTSTARARMTAEHFYLLSGDGVPRELVEGEVIEMTPAGLRSAQVASRINTLLGVHVDETRAGIVIGAQGGFVLARDPDTVRSPDVAFVSWAKLPEAQVPSSFGDFAPDLAVEVLSPTDRETEVARKVQEYLNAGTQLVWVVFPEMRRIRVHAASGTMHWLDEDDTLTADPVLPGFSCPVREVFEI